MKTWAEDVDAMFLELGPRTVKAIAAENDLSTRQSHEAICLRVGRAVVLEDLERIQRLRKDAA